MSARVAAVAALLALTAACAGDDGPPAEVRDTPEPEAAEPSVFDPVTESVDRAEGVQSTIDERAEALRDRIDEAER